MLPRGSAGAVPLRLSRRRALVLVAIGAVLVAAVLTLVSARVVGAGAGRCDRFTAASAARAAAVSGSGERVVVIGDSWSAGLGLAQPQSSWPDRLAGHVQVAGFSGSGFSRGASPCARVSFADRAPDALRSGADLVVVEGGLNDVDQSSASIRTGFARLMQVVKAQGREVVVVGPASAPSRARGVPRVDELLAGLAREAGVAYVATSDLRLPYLEDRLHLTPEGHRAFGDAVAARIAALPVG